MLGNAADHFSHVSQHYQGIVLEYCYLASLATLSEEQADYLDRILAEAETDEFLNFLLIEFDCIIAQKLNLLAAEHIHQYANQQAFLREHLVKLVSDDLAYYRELQKRLREKGCYQGPVDGVFGKDSRAAVERFQASIHLQANGVLTPETVLNLAPTAEAALKLSRPRSPDHS